MGCWRFQISQGIPDNELWLHTPENKKILDRALAWSDTHPPQASVLPALERRIKRGR